jgi:gas vesicle protein
MKGFFTGMAVGIGAGLLLAPDAGSETRKKVAEKFNSALDQMPESAKPLVDSVSQHVDELVQAGKQYADVAASHMGGMADEATRLLEMFNSASKTKLMSVTGIGDATARRIVDGRPFDSADDLTADGILSEEVMANAKKELLTEEAA